MNMNSMTFSPEDPPRIYLKNCGYPGAAFSRSIGDSIAGLNFLNFFKNRIGGCDCRRGDYDEEAGERRESFDCRK